VWPESDVIRDFLWYRHQLSAFLFCFFCQCCKDHWNLPKCFKEEKNAAVVLSRENKTVNQSDLHFIETWYAVLPCSAKCERSATDVSTAGRQFQWQSVQPRRQRFCLVRLPLSAPASALRSHYKHLPTQQASSSALCCRVHCMYLLEQSIQRRLFTK